MPKYYLDPDFLIWPCDTQGSTSFDYEYRFRGHEIWEHARKRLLDGGESLDKIDCLSALKRCINHRVKSIYKTHDIHNLPSVHGKKKTLEKLHEYGIVRPSLLQDLFKIRNDIEHEDKDPPSTDTCEKYLDIVWYFLKSTDDLVYTFNDLFAYQNPEKDFNSGEEVVVAMSGNWDKVEVTAKQSMSVVRMRKPAGNWIEVNNLVKTKEDSDVLLKGKINLSTDGLKVLAHGYFSTYYYFADT